MGIDSSIKFYFNYMESYRIVSFQSGVPFGRCYTIDQRNTFKRVDHLSQMDDTMVKVCLLDSTEFEPIRDILDKMDFFNLPIRIPENPKGIESSLDINFLIGYRQKNTKIFKLIDINSNREGVFPNNSKNLAKRLRKLLYQISVNCIELE